MVAEPESLGRTKRQATRMRRTRETEIEVRLVLDGSGSAEADTGLPFLDHMLRALALHARLDLVVTARGDLEVDSHHTVEDVALVLGEALGEALGERHGIQRFGDAVVPMDESYAEVALDCGGRPYAVIDLPLRGPAVGTLPVTLLPHFLETFAIASGITLHVRGHGRDDHHLTEAAFKALARALRQACLQDPTRLGQAVSTK
jgi:imidazoleglycerol-phosphate dehydratase